MSLTKNEIEAKIRKLEPIVRHHEENDVTDSAHHQMLARYRQMLKEQTAGGVIPRNAEKGDKEK